MTVKTVNTTIPVKTTTRYTYDNNGNLTYKADEVTQAIPVIDPPDVHFGMFISGQQPVPGQETETRTATAYAAALVDFVAFYEYDGFNQLIRTTQGTSIKGWSDLLGAKTNGSQGAR